MEASPELLMNDQAKLRACLPFIIWGLILLALYGSSLYSYLLFHSLAEIFSIVIATGVFAIAWNSRRFLENNYLLFVGIAYLFVGLIDLLHTQAYKGMAIFPGYGANLPTQLWIAARYLEAASLLAAPLFLRRRLRPALVLAGYCLIFAILTGLIFSGAFPVCYLEGLGLTPFKKISEYLICGLLLGAMALLWRNRREFDPGVLRLVFWSIGLTIGSELAFTFYVSVYGLSNLVGHLLKILSFYLIYKALIETGLARPYDLLFRNLKQSEAALRQERDFVDRLINTAQVIVLVLDAQGKIVRFNPYLEQLAGRSLKEVQGREWAATFLPPRDHALMGQLFLESLQGAEAASVNVNPIVTADGREREIEWRNRPLTDAAGNLLGLLSIGQDITERQQAETALRNERDFVAALLETVGALVVVLDPQGRIVRFNQACQQLTGYSFKEVENQVFWDLFVIPEEKAGVQEVFEKLRLGDFPKSHENYWLTREGSRRLISWSNTALTAEDGSVKYIIATGIDITARKRAELDIRQLNAELEKKIGEVTQRTLELEVAYKELESFSYMVSHDLRAPLRSISGFCRALEQDCGPLLGAEGREYLDKVQDSSRQMSELIEELLQLSRMSRAEMRQLPVDLSALGRDIAAELRRLAPARQVEFAIGEGLAATGDPTMLRLVLANLLGNAWKFTGKTPEARIEFRAMNQSNGARVFLVRDNGAGFDMNYVHKLFGAFQRLHSTREFPGTGVGLATVQRIIQRHGGRVWAEGAPGRGATFYFTLPETGPETA
jgi:PAS domain S-box-containing protein